jgi:thiamine biosynthesis lipoprotein
MSNIVLDPDHFTVAFKRPGVMLDLGAIGKGCAIEQAALLLEEAGVTSAIVHGGTSSTFALGRQPSGERWKVAITSPAGASEPNEMPLAVVELENESLSVSAVWGRSFRAGEKTFGHIIDRERACRPKPRFSPLSSCRLPPRGTR